MEDVGEEDALLDMQEVETSPQEDAAEPSSKEAQDDESDDDANRGSADHEGQLDEQTVDFKVGDMVNCVYGKGSIQEIREDGG